MISGMLLFPLQVQAEKKKGPDTGVDRELDTGLEKEADSDVDFDTEREEMLGYLTKENLFSESGRIFRTGNGNELLRAGEEYLKTGSVGKPCRDRRLYQRGTGGRT